MRPHTLATLSLVLLLGAASAQAQTHSDPVPSPTLDAWVGSWTGTGTQFGMPATETATFAWEMNGMWLVGHHQLTLTHPDGTPQEGTTVSYQRQLADGTFEGVFIDSMGMLVPFTATLDGSGNLVMSMTVEGAAAQVTASGPDAEGNMALRSQMTDPSGAMIEVGAMTYTRTP